MGDHTVLFAGNSEQIEIRHRATSRAHYADGSLRACRFLAMSLLVSAPINSLLFGCLVYTFQIR